MANTKEKTYWPHMILGFLAVGLTLSYWTVKSAMQMPVQESNQYMLKYQMADININQILEAQKAFDKDYIINILNVQMIVMMDNVNSNRPQSNLVKLSKGNNDFSYKVLSKKGQNIADAKVTFLLTQPHSRTQDQLVENVPYVNGKYSIEALDIQKEGRYTLQFRAEVGDTIGYSEISAYLKPLKP
ncbi:MAG: hypothetical protein DRQ78_00480 [Epsilonproteobacteria bacterium]|nr:MAG: hypothetical protein DRQ78_00480 [Campylobacterota bacterium]